MMAKILKFEAISIPFKRELQLLLLINILPALCLYNCLRKDLPNETQMGEEEEKWHLTFTDYSSYSPSGSGTQGREKMYRVEFPGSKSGVRV